MPKRNITKASKKHWPLIVLCAVMLAIGLPLICTIFSYQLNPDATSYFSIAQKYAHGDIRAAVNGYWGPMLSLLLVPFVWLGVPLIIAAKSLALIAAIAILATCYFYLNQKRISRPITLLTIIAFVPTLLLWAVTEPVTPDLLFALLLLWLVIVCDRFRAKPTVRRTVTLGAIGAAMYFTKGVGFYLFLVLIGSLAVWQWRTQKLELNDVRRRFAPVLITFTCLILPFIAAISYKYQHFTINTGASYNYAVVGPDLLWVHPLMSGSFQPPNETAYSAWEDPTRIAPTLPHWSIFDEKNFNYFASNIVTKNFLTLVEEFYAVGPLIAVGMLVAVLYSFGRTPWRHEARLFTLLGVVLIAGYSILALEARYIRAFEICGVLALAFFAHTLYARRIVNRSHIIVAGLLVAAIATTHMLQTMSTMANTDKKAYDAALALRQYVPKNSHIIADEFGPSLSACYTLELQCYGVMKAPDSVAGKALASQLKQSNIWYFVSYKSESLGDQKLQQFLDTNFEVLTTNSFETLYKLK